MMEAGKRESSARDSDAQTSENLAGLNSLSREEFLARLLECCGSTRWAEELADARPFTDEDDFGETADRVWRNLGREDWLEAFRSHPRIGERKAARETGEKSAHWSEEEQSKASEAGSDTLRALAEGNRVYEERFGHIYIVCATGKSADEMLAILQKRLENDPETELGVAAEEQRRITRIRLRKLLA